jgi:hypothetical protein
VEFGAEDLPSDQVLTLKMSAHKSWIVFPFVFDPSWSDPDNLVLAQEVTARYGALGYELCI